MNKIFSLLIKIISLALLVYFLFGITKGIYNNKKDIKVLRAKVLKQEEANKKLVELENNMMKEIDDLKNPLEIEKMAREVLNMKKSEETIYRVIEKKK